MKCFCRICNEEFDYGSKKSFIQFHICKFHNITAKEYYDKYLKKEGEGFCLGCGIETRFRSAVEGYKRTCKKCFPILDHNSKMYYDKYLKKEGEGFCKTCGKETKWLCKNNQKRKVSKYADYCSNKCQWKDKEQHEKREQSNLEKYGTKYPKQNSKVNREIKKKYHKTMVEKYGDKNFNNQEKIKQSCLNKYGVPFAIQSDVIKKRQIESVKKKYGVENVFQLEEFIVKRNNNLGWKNSVRKSHEKKGNWNPLNLLTEFEKYRRLVNQETRKWKNELFEKWDGTNHYTGEKLVTNEEYKLMFPDKHCNSNLDQPSIDHKYSILKGFLEGKNAKEIGQIENLCITSRHHNSIKNTLREKDFLKKLENINEIK